MDVLSSQYSRTRPTSSAGAALEWIYADSGTPVSKKKRITLANAFQRRKHLPHSYQSSKNFISSQDEQGRAPEAMGPRTCAILLAYHVRVMFGNPAVNYGCQVGTTPA